MQWRRAWPIPLSLVSLGSGLPSQALTSIFSTELRPHVLGNDSVTVQ